MPPRATRSTRIDTRRISNNGINAVRPLFLGISKLLSLSWSSVAAAPLGRLEHNDGDDPDSGGTPTWILFVASAVLVLLGGAFAGLTIALMGQDSIYLQVVASDTDEPQHNNARRVYKLLQSGKHWVLVTLLLANVIVNETLPVVLDRCLGGGVAAVVGSTVLIVIFGEVVPQSVCVRFGLQIGGYMSKPVLLLMWLTSPVSWPSAKLLDWVLGEDHGTVYKKSGLKTLVTLHRSLGVASERLNKDEVTIISAVLDLKEKPVAQVMTPMDDVFVMSEDTVLDEETMDQILSAGYSRIPIHEEGNPTNFLGMLLVKILITYDPEDCAKVKHFPLATLPETRPETSCLDIVNYFQEGKSHMVLVSESPGSPYGALGVVTLEDVIEELIGEEIIDESDVYIDVHKAIRRLHPAPNAQVQRRHSINNSINITNNGKASGTDDSPRPDENGSSLPSPLKPGDIVTTTSRADPAQLSSSPKTTFLMRRSSAGLDGRMVQSAVPVRANMAEMKEHLRHLGPSNPATNPKNTRLTTVKIKPGIGSSGAQQHLQPQQQQQQQQPHSASLQGEIAIPEHPHSEVHHEGEPNDDNDGSDDEHTSLLRPKLTGKDGVQALRQSYGGVSATETQLRLAGTTPPPQSYSPLSANLSPSSAAAFEQEQRDRATQTPATPAVGLTPAIRSTSAVDLLSEGNGTGSAVEFVGGGGGGGGGSPLSSDGRDSGPPTPLLKRSTVRSGSITENVFESRGFRKVVLETTSSNDEDEDEDGDGSSSPHGRRRRSGTISDVEEEGSDGHSAVGANGGGPGAASSSSAARGGAHSGHAAGDGHGHGHGQHHGSGHGKKKTRRKKRKGRS